MERVITYNLSEDIIQNLAGIIEDEYLKPGKDISKLVFVFGGKRPALFLRKELSRRIKKSFFPPRFFSIDEFVEYSLSKKESFTRISDLDACFTIYNLAREMAADILKGRQSFAVFLPWAREILSFIDQLDMEDIKIESLRAIQENASIGYDVPESINDLLKSIISIRQAYQTALKGKKSYPRGLIYLLASRHIKDIAFPEFQQIFFCGFFYLHKTEQEIIKSIYDRAKARLVFQGGQNEWSVLDKLSKRLSLIILPEREKKPEYNISVQAGFDVHSESCLAREALKGVKNLCNTVIVLPEPDNIITLLSEISGFAGDFNVSMGYPLKRSSLYALFESIFKAQITQKNDKYYTQDYLKVLANPLVKNLKVFSNPALTRILVHKIEEIILGMEETPLGGSLFLKLREIEDFRQLYDLAMMAMKKMDIEVSRNELKEAVAKLHELFFTLWENPGSFYGFSLSLSRFLKFLVEKSFLKNYPLNLKIAEKIFSIQEELNAASFRNESFLKEDIFRVFTNKLDSEMVSFSGSPLKGLQVLGLFETRSLNFENVIVMDVNEAVLPNLKIYEPLIPREVMITLGLNRLEKEEEIQRYQFRRLISGAKNVCLIYQERVDKEKSRFIEELIWEKQRQLNSFDVLSVLRAGFKVKVLPKKLEIKKDSNITAFLRQYDYSASSINTYLHCPLRFYYRYVLGLREKENLLEEPEGADIGTFIHELLAQEFARFTGKKPCIDKGFKEKFLSALDKKFADEFEKKMKSDAFLIKEILNVRMRGFLDNEKERDVYRILCLEKAFRAKVELSSGKFNFKAVIDRIDQLRDSSFLIIDYKTGNTDILPETDAQKLELSGFDRENLKNTVKSFQLPLYYYLIANNKTYKDTDINACLYSIKDLQLGMFFGKKEQSENRNDIMAVYLKALDSLLCDILNPDMPFKADDQDQRQCQNCPFFYLCR